MRSTKKTELDLLAVFVESAQMIQPAFHVTVQPVPENCAIVLVFKFQYFLYMSLN